MTLAPTTSPMEFFQSEKQRIMGKLFPQQQMPEQQGGEAYGGDYGGRERDRMRSGGADLTLGNVLGGIGNAMGVISGSMSPTGLMGLGAQATGLTGPSTSIQDQLMGGGLRTKFEGGFRYDQDLMDAVGSGKITRATADNLQRERNARKSLTSKNLGNPMGSRRLGGGLGGMRDRSAGRGGMGGALGGNTPSGRDKPGPGGKVR